MNRNFISLLIIPFLLASCQTDDSRPVSRFEKEKELSEETASPAFDPHSLNSQEKEFLTKLSPGAQNLFSSLNHAQREWAMDLTKTLSPEDAVWKAAMQEVLQLDMSAQEFYNKLNTSNKILFLMLDDNPTEAALNYAERMSPNRAVREALKIEINTYPENYQEIINRLPANKKALFLTLSEASQAQIFKALQESSDSQAVDRIAALDIQRLPSEEQTFIKILSPDTQILFLALPPDGKWMALALTKKLDPNLALQYAASIRKMDEPAQRENP